MFQALSSIYLANIREYNHLEKIIKELSHGKEDIIL